MSTMVCFRSAQIGYGLPVEVTRGVRATDGLTALPSTRRGVVGVIPGSPPMTVIAPLGRGGSRIIVLEVGGKTFGLLVDTVSGLYQVDDTRIGNPPDGQARRFVSGTADHDGELLLLIDPDTLAVRL